MAHEMMNRAADAADRAMAVRMGRQSYYEMLVHRLAPLLLTEVQRARLAQRQAAEAMRPMTRSRHSRVNLRARAGE
jgi:DNA-binding MurR/RpiR family transcriptional regulator